MVALKVSWSSAWHLVYPRFSPSTRLLDRQFLGRKSMRILAKRGYKGAVFRIRGEQLPFVIDQWILSLVIYLFREGNCSNVRHPLTLG